MVTYLLQILRFLQNKNLIYNSGYFSFEELFENKNDLEVLKQIIGKTKLQTKEYCFVCKNEEKKIIIGIKCTENINHYYCTECFTDWYKNNEKNCMYCKQDFDEKKIELYE